MKVELTVAQCVARFLADARIDSGSGPVPFFAGVFSIFGHGNVAGLGAALEESSAQLPLYRAHNEQAMTLAALAFAKAKRRSQAMACTTSIGPGATNLVTGAATGHINRLPVLLLPGDTFASGRPDPVLQQLEVPGRPDVTVNDCLRPVSRYFARVVDPKSIVAHLHAALAVLTDPADCGPVTLCLPQDVQTKAIRIEDGAWAPPVVTVRTPEPAAEDVDGLAAAIRGSRAPVFVVGGGVVYAGAEGALDSFASSTGVPVVTTQAGHGAIPWLHPACLGGVGVTGTEAANLAVRSADLVVYWGCRATDFTTGSRTLLARDVELWSVNVCPADARKHGARPVVADARRAFEELTRRLANYSISPVQRRGLAESKRAWTVRVANAIADGDEPVATDAQVIGALQRALPPTATVVCAAGGMPGELHRLWQVKEVGTYHLEYGYSCMGYEIAGGLGVALSDPPGPTVVVVGDGSYLMLNSEIATAVGLGLHLVIVVCDNGGFGCIARLAKDCGVGEVGNLRGKPAIDFAAHARALGANAKQVSSISELESSLAASTASMAGVHVFVIATDPERVSGIGGHAWDVPVAEVSTLDSVRAARTRYDREFGGGHG